MLLSESFVFDFDLEALFTKDSGKCGLLVGSPALGGLFLLLPVLLAFWLFPMKGMSEPNLRHQQGIL